MPPTDDSRHFPGGELSYRGTSPAQILYRLPARPGPAPTTLLDIAHRLQPRDYTIAALLDDHTTLTTDQLAAILFTSRTTCRHRLYELRRLRFVDRFVRLRTTGQRDTCWVPGVLSARLTALAYDGSPPTPRTLRERQDRVYARPTLEHLLDVNDFFTRLLVNARATGGPGLTRWWSERGTANMFGRRIHPDGHGVLDTATRSVGFFLELDRGTETLTRVVDKLGAYRKLRNEGGPNYPILFVLPGRTREQNLHRKLADRPEPGLAIATAIAGDDPTAAVWRLAGSGGYRLPLAELPADHGQPGPLTPGPPTPNQHPLHRLDGG